MGGERNGVERALIDSFLRFSPLNFLDFGCAPFEFFERPFITVIQGVHRRTKRQVKNPHAGPSAIRLRGLLSFLFPILSHSVPCGKT